MAAWPYWPSQIAPFPAIPATQPGCSILPCPALPQGDAFRMLQARLQPIPLMALLSLREQPVGPSLASAAAMAQGQSPQASPANSPSGSSSHLPGGGGETEQPTSPSSRQRPLIQQQRPRGLIEEKRLAQLFKSRAARLALS